MRTFVALGSNMRHARFGAPKDVLLAAMDMLAEEGLTRQLRSRIHSTPPVGPSLRTYANAVLAARAPFPPADILALLHRVEDRFRRRRWRRWGPRVLDLDLLAVEDRILPSKRHWPHGSGLILPHPRLHERRFVLAPLAEVAPDWRHPILQRSVRQMLARLDRR